MNLFLAQFELITHRYMADRPSKEMLVRLVIAETGEEAMEKLVREYEAGGPGDDSVSIGNCDISPAIQ